VTQTLLDLPTNEIPAGSIDFVTATVTDANGNNLTMGVDVALTPDGDTHTWLPATWLGAAAATRQCQTNTVVDTGILAGGERYGVYVRLDNAPAHPIIQVGWIVLTD
jgi:hypothetical protein